MSDDVKELILWGGRIRESIGGADAAQINMLTRIERYDGMLKALLLQNELPDIESELLKLRRTYAKIEAALREKHAAGPENSHPAAGRGTRHETIEEDLDTIDAEVLELLGAIAAKSTTNVRAPTDRVSRKLGPTAGHIAATAHLPALRWVFGALLSVIAAVLLAQGRATSTMTRGVPSPTLPPQPTVVPDQVSAAATLSIRAGLLKAQVRVSARFLIQRSVSG